MRAHRLPTAMSHLALGLLAGGCSASAPQAVLEAPTKVVQISQPSPGFDRDEIVLTSSAAVTTRQATGLNGHLRQAASLPPSETELLPDPFPVWAGSFGVINHGMAGGRRAGLPTSNDYTGAPGCYVACYSHSQQGAVYSVGGGINVKGQLRVPGHYHRRVCFPSDWEQHDISAEQHFADLCTAQVPACQGDCWAGGDTGGWFGIAR